MAAAGCPKSWQQRAVAGFAAFDNLAGLAGSELGTRVAASAIAPAIVLAALILVCARKYPVLFLLCRRFFVSTISRSVRRTAEPRSGPPHWMDCGAAPWRYAASLPSPERLDSLGICVSRDRLSLWLHQF
jgi:hypothetical protein